MTAECKALMYQFFREAPDIARVCVGGNVGICEVNGKRLLCIEIDGRFLHYYPAGLTREEMALASRQHDLDAVTILDEV